MTTSTDSAGAAVERRKVTVYGVVQGVGFRPFVYALAGELGLSGHVANTGQGVVAEVEGDTDAVAAFCERVGSDAPPLAVVESVTHELMRRTGGGTDFFIDTSRSGGGSARTLVAPDTASCTSCLAELGDPTDRRYRHPFVTCTHCGPRFTIVTGLPYDRRNTTMARFPMCAACEREYTDPADRRFHTQPVACHDCGPRLRLLVNSPHDSPAEADGEPVAGARELLARGAVVAVKGLGGYHLACDAGNEATVHLLRQRKGRGGKPFAVMVRDAADAAGLARLDGAEQELLTGQRRPIVLLRRHSPDERAEGAPELAESVAPGCADLGVLLPYTPVHQLLFGLPGDPPGPRALVMTSGNLGGEPIVTEEDEALERLAPLADAWLTHDRPIQVPCDDSVVRVCDGAELPVRRSRGAAPFPVRLAVPVRPALATGGDLKNVCCLGEGQQAWLSAHIGDMDDLATLTAFDDAEQQLESITGVRPGLLATDPHPGYRSAQWARRHAGDRQVRYVQHHHAHVAAAMAEHGLDGGSPVLGVAFDGTGYGDDGAVWGGEFLLVDYSGYRRVAHLSYAPLPGGDAAVRYPYRMALAQLYAAGIDWSGDLPCVAACPEGERTVLARQLERELNCVPTSSMGRLFDAVSALTGVCQYAGYEAQAAVELEAAAVRWGEQPVEGYVFGLREPAGGPAVADPAPVFTAIVADLRDGVPRELIAARFHCAVATLVRRVCAALRDRYGLGTVALSGGVFANSLLAAACSRGLREDGCTVLRHRLVPPNDGGLALGQLVVAAHQASAGPSPAQQSATDSAAERGEAHVPGGTRQGPGDRGA